MMPYLVRIATQPQFNIQQASADQKSELEVQIEAHKQQTGQGIDQAWGDHSFFS